MKLISSLAFVPEAIIGNNVIIDPLLRHRNVED